MVAPGGGVDVDRVVGGRCWSWAGVDAPVLVGAVEVAGAGERDGPVAAALALGGEDLGGRGRQVGVERRGAAALIDGPGVVAVAAVDGDPLVGAGRGRRVAAGVGPMAVV